MANITLNSVGSDIDPRLGLADGLESVRQRVEQRLRFFRGEWFLDTRVGTPWFQFVLTRPFAEGVADAVLRQAIQAVEGVLGVESTDIEVDREDRRLKWSAVISTEFGTATVGG